MNELEKWDNIHSDAMTIEEFLDFLIGKKKYSICKQEGDRFYPCGELRLELIYEHFGIDVKQLEKERRKLLESVRNE